MSGTSHRSSDILRSGTLCLFTPRFEIEECLYVQELDVQRNDETKYTD